MEDKILFAVIKDRKVFERISNLKGIVDNDFSDKAKIIFKEVEKYYGKDISASSCDVEIILSRLKRAYPKHFEQFTLILSRFKNDQDYTSSPINIFEEIVDVRKEALRLRISAALTSGKDKEAEELMEVWFDLKNNSVTQDERETLYIAPTVSELVEKTTGKNRIKILPSILNSQIDGGALRQHHILVFARPDAGKSLFALNLSYGFVKQKLKVLYIGNEDPAQDMILRFVQRLTGMDKFKIREDPEKADRIAREKGYERFIFKELAPGTPREIRTLVGDLKPDCLVVDQLRNLNMGGHFEKTTTQLERAAQMVRNIGKEFNILPVSLTQAGDSADNKLNLSMRDVDNSKTGIPGAVDLMIGIGVNFEYERLGYRQLSFPKNKLSSNKAPIRVTFDPILTKVV